MKRSYIVLIVVLVLAGVVTAAIIANNNEPRANTQTTSQADPSEDGKYLYIKEWGVRFKSPDNLEGQVVYAVKSGVDVTIPPGSTSTPKKGDIAYLSSLDLQNMESSSCVVNASSGQYGGRVLIVRSTERPQQSSPSDKQIDSFWYQFFNSGGGVCSLASDGSAESKFVSEIISSSKSLEAVN